MKKICLNCGHHVDGNYCSNCGQRTNVERLSWKSVADGFASTFIGDEAFGLRGNNMRKSIFGTWADIILFPAHSVSEYIDGCRRKYFNPVAILILLASAYALLEYYLEMAPPSPELPDGLSALRNFNFLQYFEDYMKSNSTAYSLLTTLFIMFALHRTFRRIHSLNLVECFYFSVFMMIFSLSLTTVLLPFEKYALVDTDNIFYPVYFIYCILFLREFFALDNRETILYSLKFGLRTMAYITLFTGIVFLVGLGINSGVTLYENEHKTDSAHTGAESEQIVDADSLCRHLIGVPVSVGDSPAGEK